MNAQREIFMPKYVIAWGGILLEEPVCMVKFSPCVGHKGEILHHLIFPIYYIYKCCDLDGVKNIKTKKNLVA